MSKKAIIDLGTNTFHLLIAELNDSGIKEYHKIQIPVKIGKGGINKGRITDDAIDRGLKAIAEFRQRMDEYKISSSNVIAFATSAIRNAENGEEFVAEVMKRYGIGITTIDGETEAAYIYKGINHSFDMPDEEVLAMDIGGGSVEFIIGLKDKMLWKHSFELGAARLMDKFHHMEPIRTEEITALEHYLDEQLKPLAEELSQRNIKTLIGSAGSFETLVDVCRKDLHVNCAPLSENASNVEPGAFHSFCELIITSDKKQRQALEGMIDFRVEMIVVAALLMRYVVDRFKITRIIASDYSLKEGMLFRLSP